MRLNLLLYVVAVFPAVVLAALLSWSGYQVAVFAAFAAALIAAFFSSRLITSGMAGPVSKMSSVAKAFISGNYHLDVVLRKEGWPETASLVSSLNRLMLELNAYRAFHLDQVLEEYNKSQALLDTITDAVLLTDDRGRLIHSNRTALTLLGLSMDGGDMVLPGSIGQAAFAPVIGEILASQEKYIKAELPVPGSDDGGGGARDYRLISRQFQLPALKRPGRVIVIRDVTAEKEIEGARETFFHMITHDMRAPVTSIQGYAQLMEKFVDPSPQTRKCLQAILHSSARLNGMIADILNMIKLEHSEMRLNPAPIDAGELCGYVAEMHEPLASAKKIALSVLPLPVKAAFTGDFVLLERVLSNLVGNSLKFTPSGGKVVLSCSAGGGGAEFCVEDDGPGVPEERRAEIFNKFSQLEEHKYMGFGLGLAMCKMAVELHGGRIWVESGAKKGSRFLFTIPAR